MADGVSGIGARQIVTLVWNDGVMHSDEGSASVGGDCSPTFLVSLSH